MLPNRQRGKLHMAESLDSRLARQALQMAESLCGAGIQQLPKQSATQLSSRLPAAVAIAEPPPTHVAIPDPVLPAASQEVSQIEAEPQALVTPPEKAATLDILRDEVAACVKCHELAATRTQTVFGVGHPRARLCFLGEAPGADEDRLGEPFVGRAGELLNKIIVACQLAREDVYILNVIKCRPPGNRNPLPSEAMNCRSYLDRQLELIQPEFICCLGAVATQNLLNTSAPMSRMRGKVHNYQGIKVVCTYHPAYLLRNPAAKKDTWDDMKFLRQEMGTPIG